MRTLWPWYVFTTMFVEMSYRQRVLSSLPESSCVVDRKSTACTAEACGCTWRSIVLVSTSNSFTFPFSSPAASSFPSWRKLPKHHAALAARPEYAMSMKREKLLTRWRVSPEYKTTLAMMQGEQALLGSRRHCEVVRRCCGKRDVIYRAALHISKMNGKRTSRVSFKFRNDFHHISTPVTSRPCTYSRVYSRNAQWDSFSGLKACTQFQTLKTN